ncbi:unnamed protein product [Didymodactylos carnosus]|nr:unnamed protein product [Didymodactylos carnosus]CAF4244081.1 unnamed protein product [Didymodactylos carnosus]
MLSEDDLYSDDDEDENGNNTPKVIPSEVYKVDHPKDPPASRTVTPIQPISVEVTDKQTNTETTIATTKPKDFDRLVWAHPRQGASALLLKPRVPPMTQTRWVQVYPHDFESKPIICQVIEKPIAAQPKPLPNIIQIVKQPPRQAGELVEIIEKPQFVRVIQMPKENMRRRRSSLQMISEYHVKSPDAHVKRIKTMNQSTKSAREQVIHVISAPIYKKKPMHNEYIESASSPEPEYEIVEEIQRPNQIKFIKQTETTHNEYQIVEEIVTPKRHSQKSSQKVDRIPPLRLASVNSSEPSNGIDVAEEID